MKYNGILRERGAALDAAQTLHETQTTTQESTTTTNNSNNIEGVPYATTIHLAASGLTKLSRVQAVQPLFRGLGGRRHIKLPSK